MQTVALVAATALAGLANAYQAGYPIGVVNNEVACPGVSIPANGIYASVSSVFITPDSCGGLVNVTDTDNGHSISFVPVVSEFGNCDSPACAGYVVRLSTGAWTALGLNSQTSGFDASFTVTPKPAAGTWSSIGCWSDNLDTRALTGIQFADIGAVTTTACISFCQTNGYTIAGTEYGGQCFCGDVLNLPSTQIAASSCYMPCEGDNTQICGGPNALTVYQEST